MTRERIKDELIKAILKHTSDIYTEVTETTDLSSLDSLDCLEILMDFEDAFEISIDDHHAEEMLLRRTPGQIIDYIYDNLLNIF